MTDGETVMATEVRGSMLRVLAVTRFTLREAIHGRAFLVGALLSLVWLAVPALLGWAFFSNLTAFAGSFAEKPDPEAFARRVASYIIVGTAVGGLSFVAVLITIFRGSSAIGGEIQRGTILATVARPIARAELLVGKTIGIVSVTIVLFTVLAIASAAVVGAITGIWVPDALPAIALLDLDLAIVGAVAVAASVRFSPLVATVAVLATYFGVTNLDKLYLFGVVTGNETLQGIAVWARLLLPVGEVSDLAASLLSGPLGTLAQALVRGVSVGFEPRPWIVAYAVLYLLAAVVAGSVVLSRRDLR